MKKTIFITANFSHLFLTIFATILLFLTFPYLVATFAKETKQNPYQQIINTIYHTDEKIAYLTFDDGPSKTETEKILDILKEENVKVTFFVLGKQVKELPEIVKREYDEGHYIASHGYSHNNQKLYENFYEELIMTEEEIQKAIGNPNYYPHLFRFPNGYSSKLYKTEKKKSLKILNELDYAYIDWNALNKDSETKTSNTILMKNLKESIKGKNVLVILMHDTKYVNSSAPVLKETLHYLKAQGYTFHTFEEILKNTGDVP